MPIRAVLYKFAKRIFATKREKLESEHLISMLKKGLRFCPNKIEIIFEIGANHGQDGKALQEYYRIQDENLYLFEPHPVLFEELKSKYPQNKIMGVALSDYVGDAVFNISEVDGSNDGVSTLGKRILLTGNEGMEKTVIEVSTLDEEMKRTNIQKIDLIKLDVEGFSYDVIKGGEKTFREKVVALQVESEVVEVFRGQKLYQEVSVLLASYGFVETYKEQYVTQNDTVWVHEAYLQKANEFYNINIL
jgi:FkbM family methyltransferase